MVLKNIQSCPLPSGSRNSEAKLTEQRISCAPQMARNVSHGFSFPLLWRVNHHWGCNARPRKKKKDKERREKEIQADQRYSKKEEEEAASREMLRISNVLQACLCHFVLVKGCRRNYPLAWLRQSALWWGFDGFQQEHLTIAAGLDFLLKATETSSVGRAVIEG